MKCTRFSLSAIVVFALAGCATGYTLVAPGRVAVQALELSPGEAWNAAPSLLVPYARRSAKVWTRDGLMLDRLIVIPEVPAGETLFVSRQQDAAFPAFQATMLPNDIEELVESSVVKLFGEGRTAVSTSGLRPHRFGEHRGVLFDLDVAVSAGPNYKGLAGAFVTNERLNAILYLGADPYYFDKHLDEAAGIIQNARHIAASPSD